MVANPLDFCFRTEQRILANDRQVLGSYLLGSITLFFLDPVDHIGEWINNNKRKEAAT